VAGQEGTVFYVTLLEKLHGWIWTPFHPPEVVRRRGLREYLKANAETVEKHGNSYQPVCYLSSATHQADVVAAAPDYWTPKPVVAAKASKEQ